MTDRRIVQFGCLLAISLAALSCEPRPRRAATSLQDSSAVAPVSKAILHADSTIPNLTATVDSGFLPDGYYEPLDEIKGGHYHLTYFGLLTEYSTEPEPRPLRHWARIGFGWSRDSSAVSQDSSAFTECTQLLVTRDTLDLSCPGTPMGDVRIAGSFTDHEPGVFWQRPEFEAQRTVVLLARVVVLAGGQERVATNVQFTYWRGD
jgi:hypothetical protein